MQNWAKYERETSSDNVNSTQQEWWMSITHLICNFSPEISNPYITPTIHAKNKKKYATKIS